MALAAGTRLGRYEIRSQLGAGGMGEVYLARDTTELEREVAVKVLPAELASDPERMRRFLQEAKTASSLNHPNIITIHEIGREDGTRFIATEYVEGETLRRKMTRGLLPLREALDAATQIAAALAAAHKAGVVHRDIKPENVMVREDGIVKVLDFGLAKPTGGPTGQPSADSEAATRALVNTSPGVVMGTVSYMSPEQARGLPVDERTDIWSLGVVLYELVSGRAPFAGETAGDVLAHVLTKEPAALSVASDRASERLDEIVQKALAKDREERYQHVKDLAIDLRRLRQRLDVEAEIERTQPPENGAATSGSGRAAVGTAGAPAAHTAAPGGAHPTSSAEYVFAEIKKHRRGALLALAALSVAMAAGAYFGYSRYYTGGGGAIRSVAVLPFQNAGGDPDMEYLSDGISENIINSLSQLSNVRVVARTTMFTFKGKEADPRAVGRQLGVDAVLTGKVVQRGDALSIQADLLNVTDGSQTWGEQYNRRLTDLMALQGEIARDVSNKLRLKLSGADEQKLAKTYTANPDAHQLYLKGLFYRNKFNLIYTETSVRYFEQATAADPSYALAFAGLADSYATLALFEGGAPAHEVMPKARDAALKAVALDDGLGESHAALGLILLFYDYDFAGAEREFKRALELSPNAGVMHQRYSQLLNFVGRHEEALAAIRRALERDPLSLIVNRGYGDRLIDARRYDEAVVQLRKTLELDSHFVLAYSSLAQVYQARGDYAASVEASAKVYELTGRQEYAALARESFARGGWEGHLRAMMARRPELWSYTKALYHASLGEKDRAFTELNRAYENREAFLIRLKVDPRLEPLRSDPRFADLVRKVGIPQ